MSKDAIVSVDECRYLAYRTTLKCNFPKLEDVLDDCLVIITS